jgi:hypothetical protein
MARTNSRKISRRTVKKKSPLPAVLILLYMACLAIGYVYLNMDNRKLEYSLEHKTGEVLETQNLIRNLKAEVEKQTERGLILRKIRILNLDLAPPIDGQVITVSHMSRPEDLDPQKLRDDKKEEITLNNR